MPEPERLRDATVCQLVERWGISETLGIKLRKSAFEYFDETRTDAQIVSGQRTPVEQERLRRSGRPTAPDELSTHLTCPATGADVRLGFLPTRVQKAIWGRIVVFNGMRWGGGGPADDGGIPVDWGHVDLGRRRG